MRSDLIGKIRSIYNQLTNAERKVADYVAEHPGDIIFMSITELACACGVGETSIFRFCRTAGMEGYQEFKMQLSLNMRDEDMQTQDALQDDGDLSTLVRKVLKENRDALEQTASLLDIAALNSAAQILSAANRIAFFGAGASLASAQRAANKFLRVEPNTICFSDSHTQTMLASTMAGGDVAVIFSYSGSTKDTNAVARLAHNNGASVVSITRFEKSPLTEFSDVTLLCGANESPLQGGSASAGICQSFIMDLLYTEYYRRNKEKCDRNNRRAASSILDKLY